MITYMNASRRDMENLMSTRLEMLREVNDLSEDYTFPDNLVDSSRLYLKMATRQPFWQWMEEK